MRVAGLSSDRLAELARAGLAWALPNLLLGSLVIVPVGSSFTFSGPRARAGTDRRRPDRGPITPARSRVRR